MPIFGSLFGRPRSTGPNPALVGGESGLLSWPRSYNGLRVTDEEAVEFTTVYRALNIIASTLGVLPIHVFDRKNPEMEQVRTPTTKYLWASPNPEDTRFKFWSGLFADQVMDGNAFIHVVKNDRDAVLELWPIDPARVEVGRLGADFGYLKVYRIDHGTNVERMLFDYSAGGEIVHITGRPDSKNRLIGFNPRRSLYRSLGIAKAADMAASQAWENDNTPPGVLSSEQQLTAEDAQEYQRRWRERTRGNIAVIGQGMKFEKVSLTPLESETLDSRRFSITTILAHFGIPSHLANDTEKTTSWGSGLFEITKAFQNYTLAHTYVAFEQAVDKHLLGEGDLYLRFELGGLLRGSKLEQYQAHRIALGGGSWQTVNEVRALDELPPIEGGDVLQTPLNMGDAGSLPGEDAEEEAGPDAEAAVRAASALIGHKQSRCPDCNKLFGVGLTGIAWCGRCKAEKVLTA